jgi:hypothetical protein
MVRYNVLRDLVVLVFVVMVVSHSILRDFVFLIFVVVLVSELIIVMIMVGARAVDFVMEVGVWAAYVRKVRRAAARLDGLSHCRGSLLRRVGGGHERRGTIMSAVDLGGVGGRDERGSLVVGGIDLGGVGGRRILAVGPWRE